jgi:hypothetical protein
VHPIAASLVSPEAKSKSARTWGDSGQGGRCMSFDQVVHVTRTEAQASVQA